VEARFSALAHTGPGADPASCAVGRGSLSPGVKRPGRDIDHPPPSSAKVKELCIYYYYYYYYPYSYSLRPSWPGLERALPFSLLGAVAYTGILFGEGGVEQIQLRTERTGIWGR